MADAEVIELGGVPLSLIRTRLQTARTTRAAMQDVIDSLDVQIELLADLEMIAVENEGRAMTALLAPPPAADEG